MPPFVFSTATAAGGALTRDRAAVLEHEDTRIVVVADGAGGLPGGAEASDAVVDAVRARASVRPFDPYDLRVWSEVLTTTDVDLARSSEGGETTVIIAVVGPYGVVGVSVGDCEAWVVGPRRDCLTEKQDRARLGSKRSRPTPFHRSRLSGVLVVGTDGLFRHARSEAIADACTAGDVSRIANRLVELPRLRSRAYPDDVALVVVSADSVG
jgi:serine/threonine protein phosphatase PrpC